MELIELFETTAVSLVGYGLWINVISGEYIRSSDFGHAANILNDPELFGFDSINDAEQLRHLDDEDYDNDIIYKEVYSRGWVRVEHEEKESSINISGNEEYIKNIFKYIGRYLMNTERVFIDIVDKDSYKVFNNYVDNNGDYIIDKRQIALNKKSLREYFLT